MQRRVMQHYMLSDNITNIIYQLNINQCAISIFRYDDYNLWLYIMFHKYSNIIKLNTKTLKYYEAYFFEEIKSFINDNYKFKINIFFFFL